jgi:two-component system nitrogen regulation response regulator NtrX
MSEKILVIGDDKELRSMLREILSSENYEIFDTSDQEEAIGKTRENEPNLVLLDLPDLNRIEILNEMIKEKPALPVVIITDDRTTKYTSIANLNEVYHFLKKPLDREETILTVRNALEKERMQKRIVELEKNISYFETVINKPKAIYSARELEDYEFIGNSEPVREIRKLIKKIAGTDLTILITGESGVGKELVTREIHLKSKRFDKPFVVISCMIPEGLFESELFGYEKGAFTGAISQKKGLLEIADEGTIFLDEVDNLTLTTQAKLLRLVEHQRFERLGGTEPVEVNVRIIATTNKNLKNEIQKGKFREDLYYRLGIMHIYIPPLRERKDDILLIAERLIKKYCDGNTKKLLNGGAKNFLINQELPGNVRELDALIARAVLVVSESTEITAGDLLKALKMPEGHNEKEVEEETLSNSVKMSEKNLILKTLAEKNWNITEAAKKLGIERRNFYRKMRKFRITTRFHKVSQEN